MADTSQTLQKSQIFYYNAATGSEIMQYFPERERFQLKVGMVLKSHVKGQGNFYYRIVEIEDDYHSKVLLKRIYLYYPDIIKLIVILILGKIVIKWYFDFFLP